ncbi:uncharacterized protein LOC123257064 [Drosophila ananassae]|uniref:uncharacterized protein LOC123257064 n=1 Tax=Drosophila ananassae TaxID=7217 RepID=UPI001CFFDDFF|nr:uncharacterized protein LOC123257064 [Drosophila ananassae]
MTMEETTGHITGITALTTSEVGSPPPQGQSSTHYTSALEEQNKNLMEIIKAMQAPRTSASDGKTTHVTLPKFNPDGAGTDATAWCTTVDLIFADNVLEGSALVIALSKALEGSASQWLSQVCFAGITWTQFKELFIQRFVGIETTAAVLINVLNGHPRSGESFAEYGSRIVTLLLSKWKSTELEEIAVSIALAHMTQIDNNLLRWVFTTSVTTRNELQRQLQAYAFKKRKNEIDESSSSLDKKKPRMQSQVKCHSCGKIGHKYAQCRARMESSFSTKGKNYSGSSVSGGKERSNIRCYKCGEAGHIATVCPRGSTSGNGEYKEKRVDICQVLQPKGLFYQRGESFPFFLTRVPSVL